MDTVQQERCTIFAHTLLSQSQEYPNEKRGLLLMAQGILNQ